jgi:flagellar motor switch protein FliN/FliY
MNLNNEKAVKDFAELLSENFKSSLATIINKEVEINIEDAATYDSEDILDGFENQAFVMISENSNELNGGILLKITDITALADLMMMGSGESKESLEDDDKDAIKELFTQLVSSVNVPFNEKFSSTVSFVVDSVEIVDSSLLDVFSSQQFFGINLTVSFESFSIPVRFFMEESFTFLIGSGLEDNESENQDFVFPEDDNEDMISGNTSCSHENSNIEMLLDVDIPVSVRVGSTRMFLKDIISLGPGNIVELEEYADEPVELIINDKVIARGEVVIVDGYFGFRVKEIVSRAERIQKLKD